MNQYPSWKYALVVVVALLGILVALPNLYGEDPAVQVSTEAGGMQAGMADQVPELLAQYDIEPKSIAVEDDSLLVRFNSTEAQLLAVDILQASLDEDATVALNLAPRTPDWLSALGLKPMNLGLDLRGGVHFLLEVDMDAAISQQLERYQSDARAILREERIRYSDVSLTGKEILVELREADDLSAANAAFREDFPELQVLTLDIDDTEVPTIQVTVPEERIKEIRDNAIQQNMTTIRNRVDELGVSEPLVQRQGLSRIVVQLPGVQDTARAKNIISATATVEFRLCHDSAGMSCSVSGSVPSDAKVYPHRETGRDVVLSRDIIVTGNQLTGATSGFDENGAPAVNVNLNSQGGRSMLDTTKANLGEPMAVVFIENKPYTVMVNGEPKTQFRTEEEVISVATINGVFSNRFQITGLDPVEARNLALLLRAGALAAPINIVEERTIGPSLGADNIERGTNAVMIGFLLVIVFMAIYYKGFGLVADTALFFNLVLMVAVLSLLQATLTLPGIAGIVLTVGMAVDANVLIFERIREELRAGNTPQASVHAGYEKAFSTIADANVTTLIAALVLFVFGTGPIKGFAVTLSIGIVTSMFTAIVGTRAIVNGVIGNRRLNKLSI
ncbi:MAG: protein translocase subunit SecD [Gammaproteobacteria bacterium]|nr:protein translocase subunit SecD [Gammaproteobacteria bacterium]